MMKQERLIIEVRKQLTFQNKKIQQSPNNKQEVKLLQ